VTAGATHEEVWIAVADTGPGIASEEQTSVFEAFYRSDRERRFPQGLGLGLTIARDLVIAHGGTLELKSELGEGSRFTVRLPRALSG
jgi:two-component system OmpR family sensor kinase